MADEVTPLVAIDDLSVTAELGEATYAILRGISLKLDRGRTLGIVGESGSGKSMTSLALLGLLPRGLTMAGRIAFDGDELSAANPERWRATRGRGMGMIFQEPMTALNPVMTAGAQVAEMLVVHAGASQRAALETAVALFDRVGIAEPRRRASSYPHEMSGGMRQRVMIAMAIALKPKLLIADEPTTALDASVEAQILDLLAELQADGELALLLISHNFAVIGEMSDEVAVMYAGRIVEQGKAQDVLSAPAHPYTTELIASIPSIEAPRDRLSSIPGVVPHPRSRLDGCWFAPRCPRAVAECAAADVPLREIAPHRLVACVRV